MSDFPDYDIANLGTRLASVTEADVNGNGLALELFHIWNTLMLACPASLRPGSDGVPGFQPQRRMVMAAGSGPVWADRKNRYSSKVALWSWRRARNSRSRRSIGRNSAGLFAPKSPSQAGVAGYPYRRRGPRQ
ncbi:hypothetical protein V4R08_00255 [Nitrobacter sp. NHB1]|uniref:hypothetical protein n=1 Tax=Nitrobacter sp. NHB1 TaxID=3119830 RepID=UPI002FFF56D1